MRSRGPTARTYFLRCGAPPSGTLIVSAASAIDGEGDYILSAPSGTQTVPGRTARKAWRNADRETTDLNGRGLFGIIAPHPAHRVRENRAAVVAVVAAFAEDVFVIVIFFFERRGEVVISDHPVPTGAAAAIVVRAILHEDA